MKRLKGLLNIPKEHRFSTLTNLAFIVPSLIAMHTFGLLATLFSLSCLYLVFGSGVYHYHKRHEYVWSDWSAMFMVFSSLIGMLLAINNHWMWISLFGIVGVLLSLHFEELKQIKYADVNMNFVALGLLYVGGVVLVMQQSASIGITSVCVFALAFLLRIEAEKQDDVYDLLHGVWHILAATGLTTMLLFNGI